MIVESDKHFDVNQMVTDFMINGFYCFHCSELESVLENTEWTQIWEDRTDLFNGKEPKGEQYTSEVIQRVLKDFREFTVKGTNVTNGVDEKIDRFHTDEIENIDLEGIVYQSNLYEGDGGELIVRGFDGIERVYFPKDGDVVFLNHKGKVEHMVKRQNPNKDRIVIHITMNYND